MTKFICILFAAGALAFGQSAAETAASLPPSVVGTGVSWDRGQAYPLEEKTLYGHEFFTTDPATGKKVPTSWYVWTQASTPIAPSPAGNPVPSTLSAGVTYVAAQSASGSVLVLLTGMGGLSASQTTAGGQFNGNIALAFRLGKSNWYLAPGIAGSTLAGGSASGTFVAAPGIFLLYGLGR